MEDNNITNELNETKSSEQQTTEVKTAAKPAAVKSAKAKDNDKNTFADYKAEFKKIVWPSRSETIKKTATVVVVSLIVGVIIFGMDTMLSAGYGLLYDLVS